MGASTAPKSPAAWRICIETGGTFTDCVAISPAGEVKRAKVLSSGTGGPGGAAGEPATVHAARLVTGTPPGGLLPPAHVRFATTRGTNALLERKLTTVALFVTEGFGDLLEIGDQRRPELFALLVRKPPPLHGATVEIRERVDASGRVLTPINIDAALEAARPLLARGIRAAAIALVHSWKNPEHEQWLAAALRAIGFEHVSVSSELSARIKIVPRARTAVVNAALSGPIEGFLAATVRGWEQAASTAPSSTDSRLDLEVMTSTGGLAPASEFRPKDSLVSGPAAGVRGAEAVGRAAGFARIIAFDMGGTSTDVTRIDGNAEYTVSHKVGDVELLSPAIAVHSVAAGGGSICELEITLDRARPVVGPRSAGADPGPACYGRGGPLTITDVNLLLGRLDPARFQIPVSIEAARVAYESLRRRAESEGAKLDTEGELLEAFLAVANQRMASAIRAISVRKGYDPAEYSLVAFGGAGGQHACAVADDLGIKTILCPADASLLSAAGLLLAGREVVRERQVLRGLSELASSLGAAFEQLEAEALAALPPSPALSGGGAASLRAAEGGAGSRAAQDPLRPRQASATSPAGGGGGWCIRHTLALRYRGQDHTLEVPWLPGTDEPALRGAFEARGRVIFGHVLTGREVEIESMRLVMAEPSATLPRRAPEVEKTTTSGSDRAIERSRIGASPVSGPLLIVDRDTTIVVDRGWIASARADGTIVLTRPSPRGADARQESSLTLRRELLAGRLESLGESMGEMLGRTAISTNVKERLDYSCALLDAAGDLVVSAPHIPVHLGALGVCVRTLVGTIEMKPGDVVITNHPALGGSHLPDVTLVAPAHDAAGKLIGFAACRAHHAEIGGTRPGSMPPDARTLEEEGVVIPPMHLVQAGGPPRWEEMRRLLTGAKFPTRNAEENLADLGAQLAAVRMGVEGLARIASSPREASSLADAMDAMKARAESHARSAISRLGRVDTSAEATLDDGTVIRVRVEANGWHEPPSPAPSGGGAASLPAAEGEIGARASQDPLRPRQASATSPAGGGGGCITLDFTGTSRLHPGNLNAPAGVIHSAAMYVVRLLIDAPGVPLNDGLMRPVRLILPPCFINPPWDQLGGPHADPSRLPAVAGGNVETSQQVVNLLLRALGLAAESQGTMNNLLFGNARLGYYETIGGGSGATPRGAGGSGVHSHMSNTAITDPEILEHRYPVRLERFAIRRGSGGAAPPSQREGAGGRPVPFGATHSGGDGLTREITFLEPVSVSLLTSNRHMGPRGLGGAPAGAPGEQHIVRAGAIIPLRHIDGFEAQPGDRLVINTPGGGACRGGT